MVDKHTHTNCERVKSPDILGVPSMIFAFAATTTAHNLLSCFKDVHDCRLRRVIAQRIQAHQREIGSLLRVGNPYTESREAVLLGNLCVPLAIRHSWASEV